MNYEDLIQQNISEARAEYESIINFIIPIKREYNDLLIKRKEQEKALEVVSEEFSQMSLEYQELRTKLDDIIEQEIQEHKSIIRNYEEQEGNLKEIIEKNESILKKIQEEEKYLENEKNILDFREKVISDKEKDLSLSKSQINDKSLENTKKEQELAQKEQELLSKIQEVNNRQS